MKLRGGYIILGLVAILFVLMVTFSPTVQSYIPPTPAWFRITSGGLNVTAGNSSGIVNFIAGTNITITPNYAANSITFSSSSSVGDTGNIWDINCPAGEFFNTFSNSTHPNFGCATPTFIGDNLGNHIATQNLNMSNFNIIDLQEVDFQTVNISDQGFNDLDFRGQLPDAGMSLYLHPPDSTLGGAIYIYPYNNDTNPLILDQNVNTATISTSNQFFNISGANILNISGGNASLSFGPDDTIAVTEDLYLTLGYIKFGSDPAEAGKLRFANTDPQCWEASPAGTDQCISNDASENFVFDTNWNNIDTNSNPIANPKLADSLDANSQVINSLGTPAASTDAQRVNRLVLGSSLVTGTCANNDLLKYQSSNSTWICSATAAGGIASINGDSTAAQVLSSQNTNELTITDIGAGLLEFDVGPDIVQIDQANTYSGSNAQAFGTNFATFGSDPGDSLDVRFSNAGGLSFEASPAGTDGTIVMDSSENLILNSGWNNVDLGLNPLINSLFDTEGTGNQLTSIGAAAGDMLVNDGTEYQEFDIGTGNQILTVNSDATNLAWVSRPESLAAEWPVDRTWTNIGTSYVNAYNTGLGDPIRIDTNGMTKVSLVMDWTKIGAGTQSCGIVNQASPTSFLIIINNLASGLNTNATQTIPAAFTNTIVNVIPVCKSTTSTDDPVWLTGTITLKP